MQLILHNRCRFEIPPEAITFNDGDSLFKRQTDFSASIVGIPNPKTFPPLSSLLLFSLSRPVMFYFFPPFLLLNISTPAQLVPPAPATSIFLLRHQSIRRATSDEIPAPISFTIKGTGSDFTSNSIPSSTPLKFVSPSG